MDKNYYANVENVLGCAYDNNKVLFTASASASANSNISESREYDLAFNLALENAKNLANLLADTSNINNDNIKNTKKRLGCFCGATILLSSIYYGELNIIFENLQPDLYAIVYGGRKSGTMGQVAELAIKNNLSLYGYDNVQYGDQQFSQANVTLYNSLIPTENALINNTDIALILPGQYGTLLEFSWLAETNNIDQTKRKIIIWNIDGYFDFLIAFLDSSKFQTSETTTLVYNKIVVCNTYQEVIFNIKNTV